MIAVRKATVDDVPLIHRLLTAMAAETGAQIGPKIGPKFGPKLGSTPATLQAQGFGPTPRFHAVLAETDVPLGVIVYFPEYSTWRGQMGLFVQDIYLTPDARGLGLGRKLLVAAMDHADWSPQFLTLMVAHQNISARAFYDALGMVMRDSADQLILEGQGLAALMSR